MCMSEFLLLTLSTISSFCLSDGKMTETNAIISPIYNYCKREGSLVNTKINRDFSICTSCGSLFAQRKNHCSYMVGPPKLAPITPLHKTQLACKVRESSPTKIYYWEVLNLQTKDCCKANKQQQQKQQCVVTLRNGFVPENVKQLNQCWWILVQWVKVSQWKWTPERVRITYLLVTLKHYIKRFHLSWI